MIKVESISRHGKDLTLSTYFQKERFFEIVHTYSIEDSPLISSVNSIILNDILTLDFEMKSLEEIKIYLKNFFVDLNWKLFPKFDNSSSIEHGISLLFVYVENDKLLIAQFGRLLCGVLRDNKIITIGSGWENFVVKPKSELNLLGFFAKDISFKIYEFELEPDDLFFVLPTKNAEQLQNYDINNWNLKYNIEKMYNEEEFPYSVLSKEKSYKITEKKWYEKKNARISASILLIMIFFSALYVYYGNNQIENQLDIQKKIINKEIDNIDLDKIVGSLNIKNGLLLIPKKNISLKVLWTSPLSFPLTYKPMFDTKNFYFVSHNKIISYSIDKDVKKWQIKLDSEIYRLSFISGNRLLVKTKTKLSCIDKSSGKKIWDKKISKSNPKNKCVYETRLISYRDDRRLLKSILLVPSEREISLINTSNGDTLHVYHSKEKIYYVSDFNDIKKNIYVYAKNKIICLNLEIRY